MKLLLDTQAFIWWDNEPGRLGPKAGPACFDRENELLVSVATAWEIQIKTMLGKLRLRIGVNELINAQVQRNHFVVLPVALGHVLPLESLPSLHKDPFDRLLVAQALAEGCTLVTNDPVVTQYPVPTLW